MSTMTPFMLDRIETWQNKKILIVGYGKEGRATEEYIRTFAPKNEVQIVKHTSGSEFIKIQQSFDFAIKSPGVPPELVQIPYTTATNLFFAAQKKARLIGITGTKGKSTSSSLLAHIIRASHQSVLLVGNIGVPALEVLQTEIPPETWIVFELSSYQLGDCRYSPHVALVMSLFPEHMNYHGSLNTYYEAKRNIIRYQTESDYFVYNPAVPLLREWASHVPSKAIPFESSPMRTRSILQGEHNRVNIDGVTTVCRLLTIPEEAIESGIRTFSPLPHRLQNIGTFHQITFYDDAISTTPESTIAALDTLDDVHTLLLGGLDRGYDFKALCGRILRSKVRTIILFPETGARIRSLLEPQAPQIAFFETSSMKEAVKIAYKHTPPGTICLLSTASPSYTLWKNFEEKGDQFALFVSELSHAS